MEFKHIELKGFKRLKLRNIEHLTFKPTSKIQLILGSNGSGKSSLVNEITPLPGLPNEYDKDGYKYIELIHNNSLYQLKSSFATSGNTFSFIKDNEELNPGSTASTFKVLVKQHFNITNDVHDILTGLNRFSLMSISERRNWFTKISNTDYTFAIQYYNRVKDQHRDIVGTIKVLQARLVQESSKILTPEEDTKLREELKFLNETLDILLEQRVPFKKSASDYFKLLQSYETEIHQLSNQFRSDLNPFKYIPEDFSIYSLNEYISNVSKDLYSKEHYIKDTVDNLDKLMKLKDTFIFNNVSSLEDVDKSISEYEEELGNLYKHIKYNFTFSDNKEALASLTSVQPLLAELSVSIIENSDKKINREAYSTTLDQLNLAKERLKYNEDKRNQLHIKLKELEHLKTHDKLECPKCNHKWTKNYSEKEEIQTRESLELIAKYIDEGIIAVKATESLLETIKGYLETYRTYTSITTSTEALRPIWDYITEKDIIFNSPRSISSLLDEVKLDLQYRLKIDQISTQLKQTLEIKEKMSNDNKLSISELTEKIDQLNNNLFELNRDQYQLSQTLKHLKQATKSFESIQSIVSQVEKTEESYHSTQEDLLNEHKRSFINEIIKHIQLHISDKEQLLSKVDIQKALVKDLNEQIKEYKDKAELLKLAVKALSPTEGLIAKGLTGFINHFISQMNSFIKKIWLYPLEVLPVSLDESEVDLDYKFQVKVNDSFNVPEISKGSFAMREIIDLAFKIVSMHYLGLQNAPLILDEFAASFDHAHRESAIYAITQLMTSSQFSQIYMISHYANSYGSLKNTDVTVLCPSNIVIPKDMVFNNVTSIA